MRLLAIHFSGETGVVAVVVVRVVVSTLAILERIRGGQTKERFVNRAAPGSQGLREKN